MESADLVIVLVVVAIGAFAGGILFGMWLVKRIQPETGYRLHGKNLPLGESRTVVGPDLGLGSAVPISGKFQPTAPNRIGWPALRRELEEDDPEAKRWQEIMTANGPTYDNSTKR